MGHAGICEAVALSVVAQAGRSANRRCRDLDRYTVFCATTDGVSKLQAVHYRTALQCRLGMCLAEENRGDEMLRWADVGAHQISTTEAHRADRSRPHQLTYIHLLARTRLAWVFPGGTLGE